MTQLQKWQAVNQCETPLELRELILQFADKDGQIQGRTRKFNAAEMLIGLSWFMEGKMYANVLTREFGIRQQAIYLKTFIQ
jgi:hypothetical protein